MNDSESWADLQKLCHLALERPVGERALFIGQACGHDEWLRHELESLLALDRPDEDFLDRPAIDIAARELAAEEIDSASIEPGSLIGPYRILEQIARGGMGVVYRAEQQYPVRRIVALKIIKPAMDTSEVIARFESERQALALMDHPAIAKVFDAGPAVLTLAGITSLKSVSSRESSDSPPSGKASCMHFANSRPRDDSLAGLDDRPRMWARM